jgi:hypothetical protein
MEMYLHPFDTLLGKLKESRYIACHRATLRSSGCSPLSDSSDFFEDFVAWA